MYVKVTVRIRPPGEYPTIESFDCEFDPDGGFCNTLTHALRQADPGFNHPVDYYIHKLEVAITKAIPDASFRIICLDRQNETWISSFIRPKDRKAAGKSNEVPEGPRPTRFEREPVI